MEREQVPGEYSVPMRHYFRILWLRKWIILLCLVLFAAAGAYLSTTQTPKYSSEAQVLVEPLPTLSGLQQPSSSANKPVIDLATEAQIVESSSVAALAKEKMGTSASALTIPDLLSEVSAAPSGGQILLISFTDPSPPVAQKGAQAFADAYLGFKTQQTTSTLESLRSRLDKTLNQLSEKITKQNSVLATATFHSTEWYQARSQLSTLQGSVRTVQAQLSALVGYTVNAGEVIGPATAPKAGKRTKFTLPIAGAMAGLLIGMFVGFGLEGMSDRIRGHRDVEQQLDTVIVGVIPKVRGWSRRADPRLVMLDDANGAAAEAYRKLRMSVLFSAHQRDAQTILVTSVSAGEGKTTTVANLGVALAQADKRVTIVSADLRKPRIHEFLHTGDQQGLAEVLLGHEQLVSTPTTVKNLRFVSSGSGDQSIVDLLESDAMRDLLLELRQRNDFVLVDSPPLLVADPLLIAPIVDGILFVVDAQSAKRTALAHAREELDSVGAVVLGAILNDYDPKTTREDGGYYVGTYGRGYGYGYGSPGDSSSPPRQSAASSAIAFGLAGDGQSRVERSETEPTASTS
jgi:succinoglycan biosynthesis transport protein ExoP